MQSGGFQERLIEAAFRREAVEVMADKLALDLKAGGMDTNVLLAVLARAGMRLTVDDDSQKEKSHG